MKGIIPIGHPNLIEIVATLMCKQFEVDEQFALAALGSSLQSIVGHLRKDISVFIETDYVDKVYRDSYYNYFSSKAECYSRDCIRLSLLDNSSGVFTDRKTIGYDQYEIIRKSYLGFIVVRPTIPSVIGRSAISPQALDSHDFKCCLSPIQSTVNGFKVKVDAFPFSSQDCETITCAETTLWALMEYYGNKYPEYSPVRPSEILENLECNVACRQLPSNGLTVENVTYALKTFGFGPQLYAASSFGVKSPNILSCYVESGIPVVVALSNAFSGTAVKRHVNHAVLCIGHEVVGCADIDAALTSKTTVLSATYGNVNVLDYDDIEKRFVFIDDNCPPYQKDFLSTPADRYIGQPDWNACRIVNFVAPLYKRIYLEPFVAKEFVKKILASNYFSHLNGLGIVVRTYLCSTRSFHDYVNKSSMTNDMKDMISGVYMPKFIWITEISRIESFKRELVDDLIVIDATSYETSNLYPLMIMFADNACYRKGHMTRSLCKYSISTSSYKSYSNLK